MCKPTHHGSFKRPRFTSLWGHDSNVSEHDVRCLPDLISFNATNNPEHVFCLQAETRAAEHEGNEETSKVAFDYQTVTFRSLDNAVSSCCKWLSERVGLCNTQPNLDLNGKAKNRPVAIYLESGIGIFIYLSALLAMNIPVVLISARLSEAAVEHLLRETLAGTLLVSTRTKRAFSQNTTSLARLIEAESYGYFMEKLTLNGGDVPRYKRPAVSVDEDDCNVLILHSSGTTGMPKPIRLAHRYLLGYSACHSFAESENVGWTNTSTLPLYHGFGLLAPCLSLSTGMSCCFPPSSIIPAAQSTLDLLESSDSRSLMTVPSILEDIIQLPKLERARALGLLASLKFVAVGGGPIKIKVGEVLVENGVKLLNHYGATEIGAIAPIFSPKEDYDWHYLRLRTDLGLHLRPLENSNDENEQAKRYKLIGYPCGWKSSFEVQDELELRPQSEHIEVRILGRRDDLIVLKTGEKVSPTLLENNIGKLPSVKSVVCVGEGYFELVVIVEPSTTEIQDKELIQDVWNIVSSVNMSLDQHARISSKNAIIVKPREIAIPRSDKGSIMRKEVQKVFLNQIEAAYRSLDRGSFDESVSIDIANLEGSLNSLVRMVVGGTAIMDTLQDTDDLFELGMDSLQTTRLARYLRTSLESLNLSQDVIQDIGTSIIYRNPSIKSLARALRPIINGVKGVDGDSEHRERGMVQTLSKFLGSFPSTGHSDREQKVILITGSSGGLGIHVLGQLANEVAVSRIVCLNRVAYKNGIEVAPDERHKNLLATAGVVLSANAWEKIEFVNAGLDSSSFELSDDAYLRLARSVTHIIHMAWPMDFKRSLTSFETHISATRSLINLAILAHRLRGDGLKPRLLFASSIAVVARYKHARQGVLIPETSMDDPGATTPMGYAEAKWVCEQMLHKVAKELPQVFDPLIVRIGQLSGSEHAGYWKTEEHFPTLVKLSQDVGALPALQGTFSWLPMNRAAKTITEILFQAGPVRSYYYHVENPIRQSFDGLMAILAHELGLSKGSIIAFDKWLNKVKKSGKAASLHEFFENDFTNLAGGVIALDTTIARGVSPTLRGTSGVDKDLISIYLEKWVQVMFLERRK